MIGLEDFIVNQGAKPTAALIVAWNLLRRLPPSLFWPRNIGFLILIFPQKGNASHLFVGKTSREIFCSWEILWIFFCGTSVLNVINSPGFIASCLHPSKGGRCSLWWWQPAREQCHKGCLSDISPWTGPSRSFAEPQKMGKFGR